MGLEENILEKIRNEIEKKEDENTAIFSYHGKKTFILIYKIFVKT